MIDSERFKLLYGPYVAPKCRVGDKLPCEYRGREVTVRGMSDGLIQWPSTRRRGAHSLIVSGDLIRAVRTESSIAVAHHWGVNKPTVWKWRQALGVPKMTAGSTRLRIDYATETLTPEVRALGREAMRSPRVRAKLSASKIGRPPHPKFRAAALEAAQRPKSEAWKRGLAERSRKMWEHPQAHDLPARHEWTDSEIALLGTDSDRSIAKMLGITRHAVFAQRHRLNIPRVIKHWTEAECKLLGTATDDEIARKLGRTVRSVRWKRDHLGIPNPRTVWTEQELKLVGTDSDRAVAQKLARGLSEVRDKRVQLKIPAFFARWSEEEDSWLGTDTDRAVAKALKRTEEAVSLRRQRLRIPAYREE